MITQSHDTDFNEAIREAAFTWQTSPSSQPTTADGGRIDDCGRGDGSGGGSQVVGYGVREERSVYCFLIEYGAETKFTCEVSERNMSREISNAVRK